MHKSLPSRLMNNAVPVIFFHLDMAREGLEANLDRPPSSGPWPPPPPLAPPAPLAVPWPPAPPDPGTTPDAEGPVGWPQEKKDKENMKTESDMHSLFFFIFSFCQLLMGRVRGPLKTLKICSIWKLRKNSSCEMFYAKINFNTFWNFVLQWQS